MSQFLHPRKVYAGWIESYFIRPWLHDCIDFKGGLSGKDFWMSILAWVIVTLGIVGVLTGLIGLLGPSVGFATLTVCCWIWGIFSLVAFVAMCVRLGNSATSDFKAKMLPIDRVMIIMCILFFVFGLLMMITTLHSEILRPDPGVQESTEVPDSIFVSEEPIFTYQESDIDTSTAIEDTMQDLNEPDMVSPEESFDPTISGGDEINDAAPIDTTQYF